MVAMDVAEMSIPSEVTRDFDLLLICARRYPRFFYGWGLSLIDNIWWFDDKLLLWNRVKYIQDLLKAVVLEVFCNSVMSFSLFLVYTNTNKQI